ncbi:tryptophan 2,3-dioxygenase [Actinoplanes lutulentus]|uniref:Tryptophan 2,3-dioxygenase n=1 Tax=Actinoplanes lutulentus TaxID=1287878 RepID=A0A327ZDP8_9ACTN|nr:hypothetical protein [Actinoplanes lutulentus]MBB2942691.1 tryptophan 2,3-dioxygenase [Actinoplanes lutulentus]RAK38272.1 tryptophan 2,3-dioxygenase [Actinoplanes lutulentus]
MLPAEILGAEAALTERGVGVGGMSARAANASAADRSGSAAHAALDTFHTIKTTFPYAETTAHLCAAGRMSADRQLVTRLAGLRDELAGAVPGSRPGRLAAWLPMTCDQDTGGYTTYAGLEPHQALTAARPPADWRSATDEVCVAALAELAATEAAALGHEDAVVRARLRGVARLLTRADVLAPAFPLEDLGVAAVLADADESLPALADAMERAAKSVRDQVASDVADVVATTALPTTRLHDEIMFIRTIQIFETMYEQIGRSVVEAADVAGEGDPAAAADVLAAATERLGAVSALFRVLGTMPVEVFAVIRGFTTGRSAVQSVTYRQIEEACAQDVYLRVRGTGPAERLAGEMRRLDAAWRRMKRGHWGLTLRIIGTVPGTGGTSGASYLRGAAETPLFPALTGA